MSSHMPLLVEKFRHIAALENGALGSPFVTNSYTHFGSELRTKFPDTLSFFCVDHTFITRKSMSNEFRVLSTAQQAN